VCASAAVHAEPSLIPSPTQGGRHATDSLGPPDPCSITQNLDFSLVAGATLACAAPGTTTDNQFLRIFDLDGEHGLVGQVCVESLDYAVDVSEGGVEVTFNVYCTPQGFADDSIVAGFVDRDVLDPGLVSSVTIEHPDAVLQYFNQPIGGCCNAETQDMAVEIATEDCLETGNCSVFFPGGNDNYSSDTKPWYIGAPDCGIEDPVSVSLITFEDYPLLMRVNVECGAVPAVTGAGMAAMVLLLGGGAAYFHCRRHRRV
jgi:hypothetical protein